MFRTFWNAFSGSARNPLQWYRQAVGPAVRRSLPAVGWATLGLALSIPIGWYLASQFPIPLQILHTADFRQRFIETIRQTGFYSWRFTAYIALSNLRSLGLASLLGVFSLGVLGLIVLMLPFVIIAYAGAALATGGLPWGAFLVGFVLPHGLVEIPEIILAGAVILRWGACLLAKPDGRSLGDVWLEAMADWFSVFVGVVVPMLILAAALETWVTPLVGTWILGVVGW
jgi:uncharacterized membrane protein SpoIIM required for sporulation